MAQRGSPHSKKEDDEMIMDSIDTFATSGATLMPDAVGSFSFENLSTDSDEISSCLASGKLKF